MQQKKFRINWFYVALVAILGLCIVMFVQYGTAMADPEAHNWRAEYLPVGAPLDTYLYDPTTIIGLTFAIIVAATSVIVFLDLLLRKKSSHIAVVMLMTLVVLAYDIVRTVQCLGDTETFLVGLLYILASIATCAAGYFFLKKAWDGDHLGTYWIAAGLALGANVFGGMMDTSYSILNAFVHFNLDTGIPDFAYWFGYGASRLTILLLGVAIVVNLTHDYIPEKAETK